MKKVMPEELLFAESLIAKIKSVLTPDLLRPQYRAANCANPMYGHCYAATEVLYYLLQGTGKCEDFKPHRGKDDQRVTHWWLQDSGGRWNKIFFSLAPQNDRRKSSYGEQALARRMGRGTGCAVDE